MPEFVNSLQAIFDGTLILCVACLMMSTGLIAHPGQIISYFYGQRLKLTVKLIVTNILVVPLIALLLLYTVPMKAETALILFLLAITPAAPLAPAITLMNKGDVDWAVGLMLSLTFLSFLLIPSVLIFAAEHLHNKMLLDSVSLSDLSIGFFLPVYFPLALGMLLRHFSQPVASRLFPWVHKTGVFLNLPLFILIFFINQNHLSELITLSTLLLCIFVIAMAIFCGLTIYPNATQQQYITAVVLSGIRNFGMIFLLLNLVTSDKNVLMHFLPVSTFMIGIFLLSGFFISHRQRVTPLI